MRLLPRHPEPLHKLTGARDAVLSEQLA
jgi:hypothetical protein